MAFSEDAVWSQHTTSGFHQQIFVMYHSTWSQRNAESILLNGGLKISNGSGLMLGNGLYVSKVYYVHAKERNAALLHAL